MTCIQASPEVQYPKPRTARRALLDRRRQRMPHLVKKGSLTTCDSIKFDYSEYKRLETGTIFA